MTGATAMASGQRLPATAGQLLFEKFQRGYAMFAIMIYEGAFASSIRYLRGGGHLLPGDTEIASTIFQVIILTILCWMWWLRRRYLIQVIRDIYPYLLILLLCAVSALWSDYQFPTLRRSVTLTSCVFFGAYCYLAFGVKGTLQLVGRATVILGVLSLIVYVAIPSVGHETSENYEGAMRGVFSQKNVLGEAMLLAISCYVYLLIDNPKSVLGPMLRIGFLLFCIVLSRSATSVVIAVIVMAAGALFWSAGNWRHRAIVSYFLIVIFSLVTAVGIVDTAGLLKFFERDPSFTGRLPLWAASLDEAFQQPLLGYGYSGFWNQDSPAVQAIWRSIDWQAPSAHNGYIDIMLQIGVVGLALYVWVWGSIIVQSLLAWRERALPEVRWILLFMLINVILNLDEGPLPYPDQFTALMPGAMLLIASWRRERALSIVDARRRPTIPRPFAAPKNLSRRGG